MEATRYAIYFIRPGGKPEPMLTIHSIERGDPRTGTSKPNREDAERTFSRYAASYTRGEFPNIAEIALYEEPHGILLKTTTDA